MTAWTRTTHEIFCDGSDPFATPEDLHRRIGCLKTYEPPEDQAGEKLTPAALRRLAAKDGWTHVRNAIGRRFDRDFCPDHKPEPAESAVRAQTEDR